MEVRYHLGKERDVEVHRVILSGWTCRYGESSRRAESSLACLAEVMATRKAALRESNFSLQVAIGSKGSLVSASSTSQSDHCDTGC